MSLLKAVANVFKTGFNQGLTLHHRNHQSFIGNYGNYLTENMRINAITVLGGYTQKRDLGKTTRKRRIHRPLRHWAQKEARIGYEGLTAENKEFLQETIQEKTEKMSENSPLKEAPWEKGSWTPESKRSGVIAKKIGIYPMWLNDGRRILTTLLQVLDNHVINYIPPERVSEQVYGKKYPGKAFLVVGCMASDPQKYTAAYNGLFENAGVITKAKLTRFTITPDAKMQPGTPLYATHFKVGDYVNVFGKTIDHGFQGVVKRWGFRGGRASHGTTKSHRRPGCIGAGAGRKDNVWKGKKMPGHMGKERRLLVGVKILRINTKYNVIWVRGPAVPGGVNDFCNIHDCYVGEKCHTEANPPHFPTFYPDENEPLPEDIWDSSVHQFSAPTITFEEEVATKNK